MGDQKKKENTSSKALPNKQKKDGDNQATIDAGDILETLKEKAHSAEKIPTSKLGVPPGWRKATVIIRDEHYEKLKDLSYWERISIKDILDEVLKRFFSTKKAPPSPGKKQSIFSTDVDHG